jgi:hypothetical protein
MSEPDAVPLPREGEVFFDVRGDARSMRLSWYADSKVAVFSIWQGGRCTGTFRLPFADLARMIQTLQSGPARQSGRHSPAEAHRSDPATGGYREHGYADSGYGQAYDHGPAYGAPSGYGRTADYGQEPALAPEARYAASAEYGRDAGYPDAGYGDAGYADAAYGQAAYRHDAASASGSGYGTGQAYGREYPAPDYGPPAAHAAGQPYGDRFPGADPYRSQPYGPGQPYAADDGLPDYDPPNYRDLPPHPGFQTPAAAPTVRSRQEPRQSPEAESVPDTAMMSFPSVPARNAPSRYR